MLLPPVTPKPFTTNSRPFTAKQNALRAQAKMISLVGNQSLRGGEHFPEMWRELIGGAMITITIVLPIILLAFYHGREEFFKRVDGVFDRLEFWVEKQIVRRMRSQKPILPTIRSTVAQFKRTSSAPQISMMEYLSAMSTPSPLSKESVRINVSPPRTPVYMTSGELSFSYNPKKDAKQDV